MTETIITAASLDALPEGATVLDGDLDIMTKGAAGEWHQRAEQDEPSPCHLPATLLWRPDQPTPTKPSVEDIIEAMVSAAPEVYAERGAVWFEAKAADIRASAGPYARAVLALLPGRTVDEVWRAAWESCCLRSGFGRDDALDDYLAGGE